MLHSIARSYFLRKRALIADQNQLHEPNLVLKEDCVEMSFKKNLYQYALGWNPNLCSEALICESKWLHSTKDVFHDQKCSVVGPLLST